MRTMDPAIIHSSFQAQLVRVLGFYNSAKPHLSDADVTILASSTLVSVATIWESFVSDLIIAYINRDPSTFAVQQRALGRADRQAEGDQESICEVRGAQKHRQSHGYRASGR
jgi:hypothetical protein